MTFRSFFSATVIALALVVSCRGIDGPDTVGAGLSDLSSVTEYIQNALKDSKTLREVQIEGNIYTLIFTDGSSVRIDNSGSDSPIAAVRPGRNSVTIVLSDGIEFTIPVFHITPTGIDVKQDDVILPRGGVGKIAFSITPAGADFDESELSLDDDGEYFRMISVEQDKDADGNPVEGCFTLSIKDLSAATYYTSSLSLVIRTKDMYDKDVTISSDPFVVRSATYKGVNSGLPIVSIMTPDRTPITSKEEWMAGAEVTVLNPDLTIDYQGPLSVKGRGNSTWAIYPKKPYAMKLESKSKILGMNKSKRWCLLANFMDRTLIRNAVAFEVSRKTGLEWTPSGRYVELFLNDVHLGNYYLCEQVKVEEMKVNIKDGYLFECDTWFDEVFKFHSDYLNVPWQFKDPDEVTEEEVVAIQSFVNEFEASLFDDAKFAARDYLRFIEPESFVDWWLVNEICQNSEVNHPKSSYLHMEKGGKLIAGPVWDFDWGTFLVKSSYSYVSMGQKYYIYRLFQDPQFRKLAKERWNSYKSSLYNDIPVFIDETAASLSVSDVVNHRMWPCTRTTNEDESLSFEDAVAKLKKAYLGKLDWIDSKMATY